MQHLGQNHGLLEHTRWGILSGLRPPQVRCMTNFRTGFNYIEWSTACALFMGTIPLQIYNQEYNFL